MKSERQELIIRIVNEEFIDTQESLCEALKKRGLNVTQATVSRDIKELALVKTLNSQGKSRYSLPALRREELKNKSGVNFSIIRSAVISADYAGNTVVVKCHTGMAQAVCAKLDEMGIENVVGTLAGDDTIFILMRKEIHAQKLVKELYAVTSDNGDR